jgi:6-phosphogluconolactonase (cycloisomerase 2 family)
LPPTVKTGVNTRGLAVTPDGRTLYVVAGTPRSYGYCFRHTVGSGGALSPAFGQVGFTAAMPRQILLSVDGRSAYVSFSDSPSIGQYSVAADGSLTPKSPEVVSVNDPAAALAVSPDGRNLYATEASRQRLAHFSIAPDGTLSQVAEYWAQPAKGLTFSPDGAYLYVASAGAISCYPVASDGTLPVVPDDGEASDPTLPAQPSDVVRSGPDPLPLTLLLRGF